jgi:hypothetical protein
MVSKLLSAATLASLLLTSAASATTLTVTPDKSTYLVGETITLSVFGDPEGTQTNVILGRLLFPAELASYADSSQEPLTSFGGGLSWFQGTLVGGSGFAYAFYQIGDQSALPVDGPLMASVTLLATAPGSLDYRWESAVGGDQLRFFGLTTAPGGSVTIVPEPATGLLVAFGLVATALAVRRGRS